MLDAKFFKTTLPAQAKAAGADTTVEIQLLNGQSHRVRSVLDAAEGFVVLDIHHRRGEMTGVKPHWAGDAKGAADADAPRTVVPYEAIAQVVIIPSETSATPRIGFGAAR